MSGPLPRKPLRRLGAKALAAAVAGAFVSAAAAIAAHDAGLYVWGEAVTMANGRPDRGVPDAADQDRLLRLCRHGPLPVRRLHLLADPESWDGRSLERLLRAAEASGIEVYAVPPGGMQDAWARPLRRSGVADPAPVLAWVRKAMGSGAPGARFAGVQLDIEPHRARARTLLLFRATVWEEAGGALSGSARNRAIAYQHVALVDAVRRELSKADPRPRLAVTMPTWLDGDGFSLDSRDAGDTWASRVQSRADFVTLMDYVGESGESGAARASAAIEREVASGPVEVLLETAMPGSRREAPRREETLYGEGEAALVDLVRRLEDRFGGYPNFLGCGAHHYLHAYGSGAPGWPRHPEER